MRLALFDLDHTLVPFDSGMAWTGWLAAEGLLPADAPARYLAACQGYVDGTLDIRGLHAVTVAPLARWHRSEIDALTARFAKAVAPRVPADWQARVARHRADGEVCLIVTATTRFIAEVFAVLFDVHGVLATESQWRDEHLTGAIDGEPCWKTEKPARVRAWLQAQGRDWADVERSWFYSDSASDLPLLEAVTDPVAVRPDARLRAVALARGWPVIG